MSYAKAYKSPVPITNILDRVGIVIPTYNAAKNWTMLRRGLDKQGVSSSRVVVVDSSSADETPSLAHDAGYTVVSIRKQDFSHGATRQLACDYLPSCDFVVFMTQDAILARHDSIELLCEPFQDADVAAVYGRQLPRGDADPIETHGRLFNYSDTSQVRDFASRNRFGFKTVFFSNSFSAYRREALEGIGGFPSDAIVSEEVTVVARMLMAGWKIVYKAEAQVIHSHHLGLVQEFSRYFDIGVHHGRTVWLLDAFGSVGGDGFRYVTSEFRYLCSNAPLWLPYAILRTVSKLVAYRLGMHSRSLPEFVTCALSAHPYYWSQRSARTSSVAPKDPRMKIAAIPFVNEGLTPEAEDRDILPQKAAPFKRGSCS